MAHTTAAMRGASFAQSSSAIGPRSPSHPLGLSLWLPIRPIMIPSHSEYRKATHHFAHQRPPCDGSSPTPHMHSKPHSKPACSPICPRPASIITQTRRQARTPARYAHNAARHAPSQPEYVPAMHVEHAVAPENGNKRTRQSRRHEQIAAPPLVSLVDKNAPPQTGQIPFSGAPYL